MVPYLDQENKIGDQRGGYVPWLTALQIDRLKPPDRLIKEALQSFGRIMHDSGGICFGKERRKANFPSSCYGAEKTMHTA